MANFSSISNYTFPSPATARGLLPNARLVNPLSQPSIISSTISGIQFPSPIYQTVSTFTTNSVLNSVFNPPVLQSGGFDVSSTTSSDWIHCVPSTMPWVSCKSTQRHSLVHFTAAPTISDISTTERMLTAEKRKLKRRASFLDNEAETNNKVFVNEDRVAEGMRNLQLGSSANNNSNDSSSRSQEWYTTQASYQDNDTGEMDDEPLCTSSPTVELAEELRIGFTKKDFVHQLISRELNKSCKQIVLWKPPGHGISHLLSGCAGLGKLNRGQQSRDMDVIDMGVSRSRAATTTATKTCNSSLKRTESSSKLASSNSHLSAMDVTCSPSADESAGDKPVTSSSPNTSSAPPRYTAIHQPNTATTDTPPTFLGLNNNNVRAMSFGGVYTQATNQNIYQPTSVRVSSQVYSSSNGYPQALDQSATSLQIDPTTLELMDDDDLDW